MRCAWHLLPIAAIVLMLGLTVPPVSVRGDDSVTVQVSVDASEVFTKQLHYSWRATDGHIVDQDYPITDWTLPNGPGIHFAYVLVSNGKGGYTEGRIAVNTDNHPTTTVVPRDQYPMASAVSAPIPDPAFNVPQIKGTVRLQDGSVCGTRDPFFGIDVTAEVVLIDDQGGETVAILNPYAEGQFAIRVPDGRIGLAALLFCENAVEVVAVNQADPSLNNFQIPASGRPEVRSCRRRSTGKTSGSSRYLP